MDNTELNNKLDKLIVTVRLLSRRTREMQKYDSACIFHLHQLAEHGNKELYDLYIERV